MARLKVTLDFSDWLVPRRELRVGEWGQHRACDENWVYYGTVTSSSSEQALPWLRNAQRLALEVVVIGYTAEACLVCIEAWHSGFKPVLLLLEDLVKEGDDLVLQGLAALKRSSGAKGFFKFGPSVYCIPSSACSLHIDGSGSVTTVNVSAANVSKTWEGPAIVVDLFQTADVTPDVLLAAANRADWMVEMDEHRMDRSEELGARRFAARVLQERAIVAHPQFWEERWAPDCAPFCVPTYRCVLPLLPLAMLLVCLYCYQFKFWGDRLFALWRVPFRFPLDFVVSCCGSNAWLQALGVTLPTWRPCACSVLFGSIIPVVSCSLGLVLVDGLYLADRTCLVVALATGCSCMLAYAWKRSRGSLPMANVRWFIFVVAGTYGYYLLVGLVLLIYLMLVAKRPNLASIFLTLSFTATESLMVKLLSFAYKRTVYKTRQFSRIVGEQRWVLANCILLIHAVTEGGRLVALVCGAVRAEDLTFIRSALTSILLGVVINALNRSFWMLCLGAKLFGALWTRIQCPSFVVVLHTECKFSLGWPRFVAVAGVAMVRGLLWGHWTPSWLLDDPKVWCWNGVALVTFFVALLGEAVEDVIVYMLDWKLTAPVWRYFSEDFKRRFENTADPFHVQHFLVPHNSAHRVLDSAESGGGRSSRLSARLSSISQKEGWVRSPNFEQVREFSRWQVLLPVMACCAVVLFGFNAGLGTGGTIGFCGPKQLGGGDTLRNTVLLVLDCDL